MHMNLSLIPLLVFIGVRMQKLKNLDFLAGEVDPKIFNLTSMHKSHLKIPTRSSSYDTWDI